jgi:hypothetical protein
MPKKIAPSAPTNGEIDVAQVSPSLISAGRHGLCPAVGLGRLARNRPWNLDLQCGTVEFGALTPDPTQLIATRSSVLNKLVNDLANIRMIHQMPVFHVENAIGKIQNAIVMGHQ